MLKFAVVLALTVGAFAASGCFYQEDYACVRQDYVKCGDDWCNGDCTVGVAKSCDKKVLFKTTCELEDYCKKVEVPCGHEGNQVDGLFCGIDEVCSKDRVCKLVRASSIKGGYYGSRKKLSKGYVEICEDAYSCGASDPWALDEDVLEVVCTKEYEVVDDMDCDAFLLKKDIWGLTKITKSKFLKMNSGLSCGEKLVGKLVCVEAEASIKGDTCSSGLACDAGYECATKEVCSEVALKKPVCAEVPFFTCNSGSSGATLCGNKVCGGGQRCEIVATKVCPTVVPGVPGVIVPGVPTVVPGVPTVVPGVPTVVPGVPGGVIVPGVTPGTPGAPVGVPQGVPDLVIDGEVIPRASAESTSIADAQGTFTGTDSVSNDGTPVFNDAYATIGDETISSSLSDITAEGSQADSFATTAVGSQFSGEAISDLQRSEVVVNPDGQLGLRVTEGALTDTFVTGDSVVESNAESFSRGAGDVITGAFGNVGNTFADSTSDSTPEGVFATTDVNRDPAIDTSSATAFADGQRD